MSAPRKKKAALILLACVLAVALVLAGCIGLTLRERRRAAAVQAAAEQAAAAQAAAEQAAAEQAAQAAAQKAAEEEAARLAAEQAAAEAAAEQARLAAEQAKANVQYGDCIGTVWVEDTAVNCDLYWGDTSAIFHTGAGCSADNGCVMPGDAGTVFVGGHTDSWFVDLKSAQLGGLIHLDTIYGNFTYKITETKVIYDTDVGECRWGAAEPSCILYTCYPFGIQTPTNQRYLVYADPVEEETGETAAQ